MSRMSAGADVRPLFTSAGRNPKQRVTPAGTYVKHVHAPGGMGPLRFKVAVVPLGTTDEIVGAAGGAPVACVTTA